LPEDGAIWADRPAGVLALYVPANSSAGKAGVHQGDWLREINGAKIQKATDVAKILLNIGVWRKVDYAVERGGVSVPINGLVISEVPFDRAKLYSYAVGCAYLLIGLFVY